MQTDVLIIGGGLSGLHTAYECHKQGIDFILLEARDRLGGRALSWNYNESKSESDYDPQRAAFDLGPSWFWPGQTRMHGLITELGLEKNIFFQYGNGDAVYEDNQGNIQRGVSGISMSGAYRLRGGIRQLTESLNCQLPEKSVVCAAPVSDIQYTSDKIVSTYVKDDISTKITSNRVVIALPPRVALKQISFEPAFSEERTQQLNQIATWMAGHAKLVCVYEQRFWQQQGYSGDVISHRGPLQEVHDASSEDESLSALFGFVGIPVVHRQDRQDEVKKMAVNQLARIFGEQALNPVAVYLQDWARESFTATQFDQEIQQFHPQNNIGEVNEQTWGYKLIWSGSEAADYRQQNNGFLEGALEASMHAVSLLHK